jgi:GT2 family glycosyltransferase
MAASTTLSVIIVNHDTHDLTIRCLDSIEEHSSGSQFEVILVDNGSEEDFPSEKLPEYPFPIRLVVLPQNTGFGVANNIGMSRARGDYFLLLNSDTYFIDDSLEGLIRFANESEPDVLAPILLNPDGSRQTNAFPGRSGMSTLESLTSALEGNEAYRALKRLLGRALSPPRQADGNFGWFSAACLLLNEKVYRATGGFDPDFFLYGEDMEWLENRVRSSYKLEVREEFRVVHIGKGSNRLGHASIQERLSLYLYWYKVSVPAFWTYLGANLLNSATALLFWPIHAARGSTRFKPFHVTEFRALLRALMEVPRYPNHFGARPTPVTIAKLETLRWDELAAESAKEISF